VVEKESIKRKTSAVPHMTLHPEVTCSRIFGPPIS
jgi:hypothetical protein